MEGANRPEQRMTDAQLRSLSEILKYLSDDEKKDYKARVAAGEDVSRHIYPYILVLEGYLKAHAPADHPQGEG